MDEGIDAVIVDSVLAIRRGLTGSNQQSITEAENGEAVIPTSVMFPTSDSGTSTPAKSGIAGPEIVDTINGVPIYADGGQGGANGAVFF